MKIKRIDFYQLALWNKILVLCVIESFIPCTRRGEQEGFKVLTFSQFLKLDYSTWLYGKELYKKKEYAKMRK